MIALVACVHAPPRWSADDADLKLLSQVLDHRREQRADPRPFLVATDVTEPVPTWMDLHSHQFSELGFGGRVVYGGETSCDGLSHGIRPDLFRLLLRYAPAVLEDPMLADLLPHCRTSDFPTWDSWTHEQSGVRELRRAHEDGLGLIVMYAVTNMLLCALSAGYDRSHPASCRDDHNIDAQLAAAWSFEDANPGWYDVVLDPIDAARALGGGKLAVVLGVEASDYFASPFRGGIVGGDPQLAETHGECASRVCRVARATVDQLSMRGVGSMFPAHEWPSELSGAAIQTPELFNLGYFVATRFGAVERPGVALLGFAAIDGFPTRRTDGWSIPVEMARDPLLGVEYPRARAGLTELGREVLKGLVGTPILVDLGHSSERATFETLALYGEDRPQMLLSGHVSPRATTLEPVTRWEYFPSDAQLRALSAYGRAAIGLRPSSEPRRIASAWLEAHPLVVAPRQNCVRRADGRCFTDADGHPTLAEGDVASLSQSFAVLAGLPLPLGFGSDLNGGSYQTRPPRVWAPPCVGCAGLVAWCERWSEAEQQLVTARCDAEGVSGYAQDGLARVDELADLAADLVCGPSEPDGCRRSHGGEGSLCAAIPTHPMCGGPADLVRRWGGLKPSEARPTAALPPETVEALVGPVAQVTVYRAEGESPTEQRLRLRLLRTGTLSDPCATADELRSSRRRRKAEEVQP